VRFLLILLAVSVAALAWSWSDVSGSPAMPWPVDVPVSAAVVDGFLRRILETARPILGEASREVGDHLRVALERLLVLSRTAPVIGFGISSAVLLGLVVRESSRMALRFSSPTWNYLGKRLAAVSAVALVALPALPAEIPFWVCVAAALGVCAGVGFYVGNLPVKL